MKTSELKKFEAQFVSMLSIFWLSVICMVTFIGCEARVETSVTSEISRNHADPTDPRNVSGSYIRKEAERAIDVIDSRRIVNFGNGVYYFPYTRASFGNMLSAFCSDHRNLEVTAIAPDIIRMDNEAPATSGRSNADWGGIVGYFITFREVSKVQSEKP